MGMNRIPVHIIGPLYTSLWVDKNWEIMKLSAQNWQRWESNKSQQCETSAIKKQVKYHSGQQFRGKQIHLEFAIRNIQVQIQIVGVYH